MKKNDKIIISFFGLLALVGISLLIMFFTGVFDNPYSYKDHYLYNQHLEFKEKKYVLFEDGGFGNCGSPSDTSWQVYQTNKNISPKELRIPCTIDVIDLGQKQDGVELILSNYSEDGSDTFSPKIEIIDDEYLLFIRGGNYYGLYSINDQKTLINEWNPYKIKDQVHNQIKEILKST